LIFVAEDPIVTIFFLADEGIVAETSIDKSINICLSEVLLCRIKLSLSILSLFKMGLENGIRMLWLHLIKISCELFVVLTEFFLSYDLIDLIVF